MNVPETRMKRSAATALICCLALIGCDLPSSPGMLPLRVSASVQEASADAAAAGALPIAYEIANRGRSSLLLGACAGQPLVAVERQDGGDWVNVSAGICQTNLDMTPIQLAAGATLHGVHLIQAGPGSYRVVAVAYGSDGESSVRVVSNIVTVRQ
jgi:hypothetical protein